MFAVDTTGVPVALDESLTVMSLVALANDPVPVTDTPIVLKVLS